MKKPNLKRTLSIAVLCGLAVGVTVSSCQKEEIMPGGNTESSTIPPPPPGKIDPSDANALTSALIIDNSTLFKGDIPPYQKPAGDSLTISGMQSTVEVSAGGEIILPFNYSIYSSQTYSFTNYYIQVVGADSTFKIPQSTSSMPQSGTSSHRIRIPSKISFGSFCIKTGYNMIRADGSFYQSPMHDVCVNVSAPKTCGSTVSGNEGLTFTTLTLGDTAGTVTVDYDTYSIPDRIDVYYDNKWVAGTGSDPGPIPPQKNCSDVVAGDGFLGTTGVLSIAYDPAISKEVTVVVSGCLGSSTAWDYTVNCPQ